MARYCPCNGTCHHEGDNPCSIDCFAHHDDIVVGTRGDGVDGVFIDDPDEGWVRVGPTPSARGET